MKIENYLENTYYIKSYAIFPLNVWDKKKEETLKGTTNNCKYFYAKFGGLFTSTYPNSYCNF